MDARPACVGGRYGRGGPWEGEGGRAYRGQGEGVGEDIRAGDGLRKGGVGGGRGERLVVARGGWGRSRFGGGMGGFSV